MLVEVIRDNAPLCMRLATSAYQSQLEAVFEVATRVISNDFRQHSVEPNEHPMLDILLSLCWRKSLEMTRVATSKTASSCDW
jgi:hypothetical protein